MVAIMIVAAFALVAPAAKKNPAASDDGQARTEVNGATRSVTYDISRVGWSYLKPTDYSKLGRSDHLTPGINQWYIPRNTNYNDTIIHNTYPYVIAYNGYSGFLASQAKYKYLTASWTTHMFYQLKVDAENITGLATGAGSDPLVVPIMLAGGQAVDGGWVNMSLYQNYLTDQEVTDIKAGVHYANTFYGVSASEYTTIWKAAQYPNDGWFSEIQGHWDFSRRAAHKFLGLPAVGDLVTEYNAVGDVAIATNWENQWIADGDTGMPYDIYPKYDYSLLTGNGPVSIWLKLDTVNSTSDKIALWFWSQTWGAEYLFITYLEKVGIYKDFAPSREEWYLNATLSPTNGDMHERSTATYHMTAWKDTAAYNNPTWMFEPQHPDYTAERISDVLMSRFDPYYWTYYADSYRPTRMNYAPGVSAYGQRVHYWQTPTTWNTSADESVKIKLPSATTMGWGIEPYWSANYTLPGLAVAEIQSNGHTGEFVLGHGYPAELYSTTYYDPATKTITLPAGKNWANNVNTGGYPGILESGSPLILMDISPVSHYNLSIVEAGPYSPGTTYTLRVTPQDLAMAAARCNQTVDLLPVSGVTFGASTHTFAWNEASWDTTIVFASAASYSLVSRDHYFYLDITDTTVFNLGPPTWDLPLVLGWNFVTIPQFNSYKASTLGLQRTDVVAGWNPATGVYDKNYIVGVSPIPLDFVIAPSTGYWIYAVSPETLHLAGSCPTAVQTRSITVPAGGGWAIIGFNTLKTTMKASNIPAMCSGGGTINTVASYNPITKIYKTYIAGVPPTDYTLVPGQAFWVFCTASLTLTYTP
jgi:hypothetical protein